MKVIAFDQATKVTGFAIFEDSSLIRYGVLTASGDDPFARMHTMYTQIYELLEGERPQLVSIEGTQGMDWVRQALRSPLLFRHADRWSFSHMGRGFAPGQ